MSKKLEVSVSALVKLSGSDWVEVSGSGSDLESAWASALLKVLQMESVEVSVLPLVPRWEWETEEELDSVLAESANHVIVHQQSLS